MQHKRSLDWQIRRLLRKYPASTQQTKEELWKGIAAALDEQQPVKRSYRGLGLSVAGVALLAAGIYFWNGTENTTAVNNQLVVKKEIQHLPEQNTLAPSVAEQGTHSSLNHVEKNSYFISTQTQKKEQRTNATASELISPQAPVEKILENLSPAPGQVAANSSITRTKLDRLASLVTNLDLTSGNNPLIADQAGRYKHRKGAGPRNRSTWSGLLFNIWDNPAYTGATGSLSLVYDDQMSFFDYGRNALYRDVFAADWQIPSTPFRIGAYHDRALNFYSLKTGTAFTLSARTLRAGKGYLSLGASVGSTSKKLFVNSFHYSDQYDINFGFNEVTRQRAFTSTNSTLSVDAGAWYQSDKFMGGISVKNANAPRFGYTEEGERLSRTWDMSAAYRFSLNKFQVMPVIKVERNKIFAQATTSLLVTYNDRITIGGTYQNISPVTLRGDVLAYVGVKAFNRLTIFSSYGLSTEMAAKDINQHFIQSGLRFQLPQ
jgi:type IX secretion system PorP/SprF family membrane protein